MNCASARCSRTIAPRITTKRAPESRAAASKSSPAGRRDLEMLLRREVEGARAAPAAELDVRGLVGALGHVVEQQVGDAEQQVLERAVGVGFASASSRAISSFLLGDEGAQALELRLVARAFASPMRFEAALRSASACSAAWMLRAPRLVEAEDRGGHRRDAAAGERASKAFGASRIRRMSCMGRPVGWSRGVMPESRRAFKPDFAARRARKIAGSDTRVCLCRRDAPLSPARAQHGQRPSAPPGGRFGAHPRTVAARALSQRIVW
jgi:hypothetical protein